MSEENKPLFIMEAIEWWRSSQPREGSKATDKVISSTDLERYLDRRWIFVSRLNEEKLIVRRMHTT